jgi:glycosyltransferase involved in cell wall biosynthesis
MIQALIRIGEDDALRTELRQKGYEQVLRYDWASMAVKTKSIYTKVHAS